VRVKYRPAKKGLGRLSRNTKSDSPSIFSIGCSLLAHGLLLAALAMMRVAAPRLPPQNAAEAKLSPREIRIGDRLYFVNRLPPLSDFVTQAASVLDREPAETHYLLAHVYMSQRRFAAALEQAEQSQTEPPDPLGLSVLGACLAYLNRREEALKIVATLSQMAQTSYVESRVIAHLHIALGNIDQAIESVAKSLDEREPFSAFLKLDPAFDPLRGDQRFCELVSRLRL